MSRRYNPDGTLLIPAILARVDALEQTTSTAAGDVAALGRSLADVTGQLRRLANGAPTTPNDARAVIAAAGTGEGNTDAEDEPAPQWDWFAFTDPETVGLLLDPAQLALDMLLLADRAVRDVLGYYGIALTVACWSLHPTVVADLLALHAERAAAYASPSPTPVSEWLTRWVPTGRDRITAALADCVAERGHRHEGRTYDVRSFDAYSVAAWWATRCLPDAGGDGDPITAFQLQPI